jgi:hypothetical protein
MAYYFYNPNTAIPFGNNRLDITENNFHALFSFHPRINIDTTAPASNPTPQYAFNNINLSAFKRIKINSINYSAAFSLLNNIAPVLFISSGDYFPKIGFSFSLGLHTAALSPTTLFDLNNIIYISDISNQSVINSRIGCLYNLNISIPINLNYNIVSNRYLSIIANNENYFDYTYDYSAYYTYLLNLSGMSAINRITSNIKISIIGEIY